jgi:hypothetical protein
MCPHFLTDPRSQYRSRHPPESFWILQQKQRYDTTTYINERDCASGLCMRFRQSDKRFFKNL